MSDELETHSTEEEPLTEEIQDLIDIAPDRIYPSGSMKERIAAANTMLGLYTHLCKGCRNKIKRALIELQLANAQDFLKAMDLNIYLPGR